MPVPALWVSCITDSPEKLENEMTLKAAMARIPCAWLLFCFLCIPVFRVFCTARQKYLLYLLFQLFHNFLDTAFFKRIFQTYHIYQIREEIAGGKGAEL